MTKLTCFKAYDVRGEINVNIDASIAYRIGRAVSQHFRAESVIIGFDARESSPNFAHAAAKGVQDSGANAINIGLAGTEEMYWAVSKFGANAGIEVTASHNPINYNGMKIVKSNSQPLQEEADFKAIQRIAETEAYTTTRLRGKIIDRCSEARRAYVDKVLSFVDINAFKPLRIVVNSGNGAAGPTFDEIQERLSSANAPLDFVKINHTPDSTFPNGVPNPLLPKNHYSTEKIVKNIKADFGIAFDGDFDRCFFFDENGKFIQGEYIVGLLANIFLDRELGGSVVHDPRVIWNIQKIIANKGGIAIQSKTGHAFIKHAMRKHSAIYGGEISAHHYFRDFAYCDSGMIPWLLVAELVSKSNISLGKLVKDQASAFPSSGEINFFVKDANEAIFHVLDNYSKEAVSIDDMDGISLTFSDWRFNLRRSNTEPLVRLNIEIRGSADKLHEKIAEIARFFD